MADIEDVLTAFRDWVEADAELKQMQGEYTGYSPSYHLASWYEVAQKAKDKAGKALADYIAEVVAEKATKDTEE